MLRLLKAFMRDSTLSQDRISSGTQTNALSRPVSGTGMDVIHPHQRCGYSDSPFARIHTFLYCRVQKWVGGVDSRVTNKLYPRKRHVFVIEKHVEDVKQEEKSVPNLLESIMRPSDPVKEELRRNLCKMNQFSPK